MKCLIYANIEDENWVVNKLSNLNPYLLRIVNKPLLEYWIDLCSVLNINDIRIVSNSSTEQINKYFSDGKKWGVEISYNIAKPEDNIKKVILKNYSFCKDNDILIFSGFFFLEYVIKQISESIDDVKADLSKLNSANITYLRKGFSLKNLSLEEERKESKFFNIVDLHSIPDYYNLSMKIIEHDCINYVLPGYSSEERAYVGMNVTYPLSAKIKTPVMIGNNVRLGEMTSIGGKAVIGDGVIVDSLTNIESSIIYSNSFISKDLEIKNKIVYQNTLISGLSGEIVDMTDDFLISGTSKDKIVSRFEHLAQILIALIQIIIQTIPFLLVLPFIIFVHNKKHLVNRFYINKSKKLIKFFDFEVQRKHPIIKFIKKFSLDKYPFLFLVVAGKLLLVGNKMLTQNRKHVQLINAMSVYKPGVYSYWESLNPGFGNDEEIHELYYLNNHNFFKNLYIYIKITVMRLFW